MLASNGSDWSSLFSQYHSGTYNNQWMILDVNQWIPDGSSSSDNSSSMHDLFWVLEEAPGLIHAEDMTSTIISAGYWASYNVAYFPDIRAQMGERGVKHTHTHTQRTHKSIIITFSIF
jgi:hypothetical protein